MKPGVLLYETGLPGNGDSRAADAETADHCVTRSTTVDDSAIWTKLMIAGVLRTGP